MLREIHISNFRGLKESGRLQLAPLTVFTGPEGSGKSTVGHLSHHAKTDCSYGRSRCCIVSGDKDSPVKLGTQSSLHTQQCRWSPSVFLSFSLPSYLLIEDSEKDKFGVPTHFYLVKV